MYSHIYMTNKLIVSFIGCQPTLGIHFLKLILSSLFKRQSICVLNYRPMILTGKEQESYYK